MKKLLFIILLLPVVVFAQTVYHISPTGNDITGDGSISTPWRSLYKATTTVNTPGDWIHVYAGSYPETQTCPLAPGVNIEGDGITSVLTTTVTTDFNALIDLVSVAGTNGNQVLKSFKIDGQNYATKIGIKVQGRSNVTLQSLTIVDFDFSGATFSDTTEIFSDAIEPTMYAAGNKILGCTITNCSGFENWGGSTYGSGAVYIVGQRNLLVDTSTIVCARAGATSNGWPIKMTDWTDGVRILHSYLERPEYPYTTNGTGDYWDFGIEAGDVKHFELGWSTVKGSVDLNRNVGVWIHDNIIGHDDTTQANEDGIILEYSTDSGMIERNTIKNCNSGVAFSVRHTGHVNDLTIRNNLITKNGTGNTLGAGHPIGFIGTPGGGVTYTTNKLKILNNTMIGIPGHVPAWVFDFAYAYDVHNLDIKNNIVKDYTNSSGLIVIRNGSTWLNDTIINNSFYNNNGNTIFYADGSTLNASSVITNNATTNPNTSGYPVDSLNNGSDCIDAGVFVDTTYSGAAPDKGYLEKGTAGPSNIAPVANAGSDQSITLPTATIVLSGSATDADGTITAYLWTRISGPNTPTLSGTTTATLTIGATGTAMVAGTYVYQLEATDNDGATHTDTVTITVNAAGIILPRLTKTFKVVQ